MIGQLPSSEEGEAAPEVISVKTHTHDISGSGLSIRQNAPLPAGTLLTAKLSLPGEKTPIRIACKVVHSSLVSILADRPSHHIGIQFLLINEADRTRIVQHVVRFEVGQV
jgi:hypothetical protein